MAIAGVIIKKSMPTRSVVGNSDSVSAFLGTGVAVVPSAGILGIAYGDVKTLFGMADVESLGINAAYDATNKTTLWKQLQEFYRMAGEGTKCYLMLQPQATTMVQLVEDANKARQLILQSDGDIIQLGILLNPAVGYAATMLNGMNSDVFNSISKAQALADWALENNRPLHVVLEGRNYGGVASAVQNLRAITGVEAGNVSVSVLQDFDYATAIGSVALNYADVGIVVGTMAKAAVSQNIGEVQSFNIQNIGLNRYKTPGLSSNHTIKAKSSDLLTLDNKGWIFGLSYEDYNGVYLNDDHSCTTEKKDINGNMNESSIWKSRTMNKVVRLIRKALIPEVKKRYPTDSSTGYLTKDAIAVLTTICKDGVSPMLITNDITGVDVVIDEKSELFTGDRTLNISQIKVSGVGNIGLIKANVGLATKI